MHKRLEQRCTKEDTQKASKYYYPLGKNICDFTALELKWLKLRGLTIQRADKDTEKHTLLVEM